MITKLSSRLFVLIILLLIFGSMTVALAAPTHQDEPATRQPTATALPPTPTPTATSPADSVCYETYTMESGDTLSSVAQQFYGEARVFELIVDATNQAAELDDYYLVITDTDNLDMGQNLCITDTLEVPVIERTETISLLTVLTQTATFFTSTIATRPTPQPTLAFDIPVGQAALTFENLSPADLVVDIIGPTNETRQIPPSAVEIFLLEPGEYRFNAHSPNGTIRLPAGIWAVGVGDVAEVTAFANIFQLNVIEAGSRFTPTPRPTAILTADVIITNATVIAQPFLTPANVTATPTSQPTLTPVSATSTPQPTSQATTSVTPASTSPQPTSTVQPTPTIPPTSTTQPTPIIPPTSTTQPTPTIPPTSTPQPTPTALPTSTPQPPPTASPTSTPQPTPTTSPTSTPQPTPTTSPTSTTRPAVAPTSAATSDPRLAPPPGRARVYLQNLFSDEAVFNINNQTVIVDAGELETLDFDPGAYSFTVGIPGGTGKGELTLEADQSWLIRVDENGGLGWAQVYP